MRSIPLQLDVTFSTFKTLAENNLWIIYFKPVDEGNSLCVWAGVRDQVYGSLVSESDMTEYNGLENEKVEVPSQDDAIALIIGLSNIRPTAMTPDRRLRTTAEKISGHKYILTTHNWADKCTWFSKSVKVEDEIASYNSDTGKWDLEHQFIIDTFHGRISNEDDLPYRVSVTVNESAVAEVDPHTELGDYTVDYESGTLQFVPPIASDSVVKVTYHYSNGSEVIIAPSAGKVLRIMDVEVQVSDDIVINDSVIFQPYGLASVFAPQLGLPEGTKIPLPGGKNYKTMQDYLNEASKSYPKYESISAETWRGMNYNVWIHSWGYITTTDLESSKGMEVRVYLEHDDVFGGSFCTATMYCISEEE